MISKIFRTLLAFGFGLLLASCATPQGQSVGKSFKNIGRVIVETTQKTGQAIGNTAQSTFGSGSDDASRADSEDNLGAEGAAGGALVGAVIGALVSKDRGKGAFLGAVVGGGLGYVVGETLSKRRQRYASQEEYYDKQIEETGELNKALAKRNQQLRQSIKKDRKEIRTLISRYNQKRVNKRELSRAKKQIQKNRGNINAQLTDLKDELKNQRTVLQQMKNDGETRRAKKLRKEIATLQKEISQLENSIGEMDTQTAELGKFV